MNTSFAERTPARLAVIAAGLMLLLGGCGPFGSTEPPTATPGQTTAPAPSGQAALATFPDKFVYTNGPAGWSTTLTMNRDGSFTGYYQNFDPKATAATYPDGTREEAVFSGRFEIDGETSDAQVPLTLTAFTVQRSIGDARIEGRIRVVTVAPKGITGGDTGFVAYRPGALAGAGTDKFWTWLGINPATAPRHLPYWALYNQRTEDTYFGITGGDWNIWKVPAELYSFLNTPWEQKGRPEDEPVIYWSKPTKSDDGTTQQGPITAIQLTAPGAYTIAGVSYGDRESDAISGLTADGWRLEEQVTHADGRKTTVLIHLESVDALRLTAEADGFITDVALQLEDTYGPVQNADSWMGTGDDCRNAWFPEEVDRDLVCGSPTGMVKLPGVKSALYGPETIYGFKSPTGNLVCGWEYNRVDCRALKTDVVYPEDPVTAGVAWGCTTGFRLGPLGSGRLCRTDVRVVDGVADSKDAPVLAYGETVLSTDYSPVVPPPTQVLPGDRVQDSHDPIACHSAEDGITCWNTLSHHGFKLSRSVAVFW